MLPFRIDLRSGESPYRSIVYAATKAVLSGELAPGERFPSVRELSQELRVNPNTAHKAVTELIRDGLLEVLPGVGTVVAAGRKATAQERRSLLSHEVEQLCVAARRLGIAREEVLDAVADHWSGMFGSIAARAVRKAAAARLKPRRVEPLRRGGSA